LGVSRSSAADDVSAELPGKRPHAGIDSVVQLWQAPPRCSGNREAPSANEQLAPVHVPTLELYTRWVAITVTEHKLLLDGDWIETRDWLDVRSPYDGAVVARVPKAGASEARRAVDAAARAMTEPLPAHKRAEILVRVAGALGRRADEAARIISAEAGKPMKAARVEVGRAMSTFTMAGVEARKLAGEVVPMDASQAGEGKLAFTLRVPAGVVGAISPFNFPLNLVAHKLAPALAAGCAVVLKPASQTPLSALFLAELETDAGLPPGWLNVLVGPASEIGDVLVADERVKLITFTGSAAVGWKLAERAPKKRVNLELGNATPVIVEADSDLEDAATRLAANGFSFAGQSCISVQRIYVHRDVYDEFKTRFLPKVEALKVGDPAEEDTDVGPLISSDDRDRVLEWIEEARSGGAEVLTGGTLEGELLMPTVVERPAPDARLACEEAFGPVVTLQPYATLDEAIALANGTRYGLQAGIFTSTLATAVRAARELEFGGVTVNEAPTFRADQMPYGGVKDSGNTREGPAWAVREMTEERLVVLQV
jgi:acyl-CoA reductase-like NAD-dependent aldehyde dehydrogenase